MDELAHDRPDVVATLRRAGCVFAEDEARLLLEAAGSPDELDRLVARRVAGEPLEQVLGWAELCGVRVPVVPGVFVPRRRSELLVREAVRLARADRPGAGDATVVVDLCCGSGAVGVAVTTLLGDAGREVRLDAADVDPVAVGCAQRAVTTVGGAVHQGDLYAALPGGLRGRVDLLLCNAPYVPTDAIGLMPREARDHEPLVALDGGPDGVAVHRRVAASAARWLRPGGYLLVETGRRQADLTSEAFRRGGLTPSTVHCEDLDATVVVGRHP